MLSPERDPAAPSCSAPLAETLEAVLRFGAQLLRAGDTAFRVRQLMGMVARGMRVETVSVQLPRFSANNALRRDHRKVPQTRPGVGEPADAKGQSARSPATRAPSGAPPA